MTAVMATGVILPPDWLIIKKVAISAEIAIIATFLKRGPDVASGRKQTQIKRTLYPYGGNIHFHMRLPATIDIVI